MADSASGSGAKTGDLERMMTELGLHEDVLDDVIVEDEVALPQESTRWMALARVHVDKPYSQF